MARVKRAVNAQKKRRTTLEAASGYRGQRSRLYRKAKEQVLHSATYAYRDRKVRKGDFRKLWITRINAAARLNDMTYNRFMQGLKLAGIELDRRVLAELAVNEPANQRFAAPGALGDAETRALLARWVAWHWVRVALGVGGFLAALRALTGTRPRSGSAPGRS